MNQLSTRTAALYQLPLSADTPVLKPEQVILRFADVGTVDIGALCYLRREAKPPQGRFRKSAEGRKVELASYCPIRANHIRMLIAHISTDVQFGGQRPLTIYNTVREFVVFMAWVDENGYSSVLDSATAARPAVQAYATHVRERVATHVISGNTGATQQANAFAMLSNFLEAEKLTRGINLLQKNGTAVEPTMPPNEMDQGRILRLCDALFDGLTELVLDNKPFPFRLAMPSPLRYPKDTLWVFPTNSWFMPLSMSPERDTHSRPGWGYNYSEGRLSTVEDLRTVEKYADASLYVLNTLLRKTKLQLDSANGDPKHLTRRQLGRQALNVFTLIFLAQASMNWQVLTDLPWSDSYTDKASQPRQGFRSIKFRADNKQVSFELEIGLMPKFRRFLALREYLLNGRPCDRLFFKLGSKASGAPAPLKSGPESTYLMLQRIDTGLNPVMPREWRAAKSDWMLTHKDISTAAQSLQNSERVIRKSYAEGSVATHLAEMTDFLDNIVLPDESVPEGSIRSAVGICTSEGKPHESSGVAGVKPDCKKQEGCLFCDKFRVHADETDVRKLLSCNYFLQQTAPLAGSDERIQILLEPIFERIQLILDEVHRRDPSLVPRVTAEVEAGELSPYWAEKLILLINLGIIT